MAEEHVTTRIKVHFKLIDHETSKGIHYWVSAQPVDRDFPFPGWVGFDLPDGISYEKAREIRDYLDDVVVNLVH